MYKIAITGPESSGKTTLAQQLAARFGVPCVPEYARLYLNSIQRPYDASDLPLIALGQARWEDVLEDLQHSRSLSSYQPEVAGRVPDSLLICDTDMLVIKVWSEYKYGYCDPRILELWNSRRYDLHLLCRPDIPWQYDSLREHPDQREELYQIYLRELHNAGLAFREIAGEGAARLRAAAAHICAPFQQ